MRFSVTMFLTDETPSPAWIGSQVEDRGLESLFVPEHTHIPSSRRTPRASGRELPREYRRTLDPLLALTVAATATRRIGLGTGVSLLAQRDPIITAKEVATLDHLSGGRVLYGVGAGWNVEEMQNHGTAPADRFAVLQERVEAMRAIWTQDEASYHGRHVRFDAIWSWPKPVRRPHPPILVGGNSSGALDRAVAYGDEWAPMLTGDESRVLAAIPELQRRAQAAARGPLGITLFGAGADPRELERYAAAGATRIVRRLPSGSEREVEAALDEYVGAIGQLEGRA